MSGNADGGGEVARTHGRHEFATVSSTDVHVGRIFAVRADEVRMPGDTTSRREVVEHPGAVAVVAIDDAGRVVLVHQYRYPLGRRLWELPAGLLDVAGEDPLSTAQRELAEEAGIAAEQWSVLVDVASSPGFTDESVRVFLARGLFDAERPCAGANEEADLVLDRTPLSEAVNMVFSGEIVNAPAVSGLLAAQSVSGGFAQPRAPQAPWRDRPRRFSARFGDRAGGEPAG
ncbi:ADP-ribose pyrophosphatase [Halopolyspora algeriensis]|uniref:ADP-ribose pyrophosphatase n=1 Tax=Halopolyspora algeriensis TaxID=1500506 RepID=A0A368VS17_9ACTN|nr:NUDIX hydrolase [Halopolyspora algeriensis]RCW44722.1 ADP-ribose pyrophosphatase [Halopolyspora algeriensis]TQM56079.1 ADP-ribose pyrophosphatase [Halopolyspora algeriensis]